MRAFQYTGSGYATEFDETERLHLGNLIAQVAIVLGSTSFSVEKDDNRVSLRSEVMTRLLPQASSDERIAAEFATLTHETLVMNKISRLEWLWQQIHEHGDDLHIPESDFDRLNSALTDIRLALGAQLDVEDDEDAERVYDLIQDSPEELTDSEQAQHYIHASFYAALTWLQETLMSAWQSQRHGDQATGGATQT